MRTRFAALAAISTAALLLLFAAPAAPPSVGPGPKGGPPASSTPPDRPVAVRVANLLALVSAEYNLGVRDGKIIDPAEYLESQLFLDQAGEVAQDLSFHSKVEPGLKVLRTTIVARKPATEVLASIQKVLKTLDQTVGLPPFALPVGIHIGEGRTLFEANCARCHGPPPKKIDNNLPPDFSDPDFLRSRNPLQLFTAITEGVKDTPMISWLDTLDERQRWSVVYYLYTFAVPQNSLDDGRRKFMALPAVTRNKLTGGGSRQKMSMNDIGAILDGGATLSDTDKRDIDFYVLNLPPLESQNAAGSTALSHTIEQVIQGLTDVKTLVDSGQSEAARQKLADTYTQFERIEPILATTPTGSSFAKQTESSFMQLQGSVQNPGQFATAIQTLKSVMETHRTVLAEKLNATAAFSQSFIILLREGFEAFLILAAITGFLVKVGRKDQVRQAIAGAGVGVVATLLTAFTVQTLLATYMQSHPASSHYVEAVAMIVASVVLFLVSYWLVTKSTVQKWTEYIRGRICITMGRKGLWTLAFTGFLAVYREGFETVIFYQALLLQSKSSHPVWLGAAAAAVALLLISFVFYRFTLKLPIRPFFTVTSILLYVMSIAFLGSGLHELQEAGVVQISFLKYVPTVDWLGLFPTTETLVAQGALALAAAYAIMYFLRSTAKALPPRNV